MARANTAAIDQTKPGKAVLPGLQTLTRRGA